MFIIVYPFSGAQNGLVFWGRPGAFGKNRQTPSVQAERRHKAKASNALRRMARGHRLDETEQGATLQQKTWKFGT
jgi:hypothetical protein